MTRRLIIRALGLFAPQQQPQRFGSANTPQCPVCHTPVPTDAPEYLLLVQNAADHTQAALSNVRVCICAQDGVMFAVAGK